MFVRFVTGEMNMNSLTGIDNFLALSLLSQAGLSFSIIKLVLLIGWVYLCLYCTQKIQLNLIVPAAYKPFVNFVTLAIGPLTLAILLLFEIRRKKHITRRPLAEIAREHFENLLYSLQNIRTKDKTSIKLLDTSGRTLTEIYGRSKNKTKDMHILYLTENIILRALKEQASDILIDPRDNLIHTVRFRIDGVLHVADEIESNTCQAVINSIKAVSGMDISDKRRPQDGAFTAKTKESNVSFRVASAGALNGEKLSIRILGHHTGEFQLETIGLTKKQRTMIEQAVRQPSGMILLCGPTGSGKTTTLYAMLNKIDLFTRNVITVEDPIEYVLPNASQIEVNPKADITFAKSLRSILRQDPDVICIGEIRDEETAQIALRAGQTGHLVIATIHSSSNSSALIRLMDLNVTPMMLATGLNMIISQRLIRKLCEHCKRPAKLSRQQISNYQKMKMDVSGINEAVGCKACRLTGYSGRIGIYDVMVIDDHVKNNILHNNIAISQLRNEGDKRGKSNLQKEGVRLVVSGITSIDELNRVIG